MAEATISAKNQIVIPKEARAALKLKAGDKVLIVPCGDRVIIMEKPKSRAAALRGTGRGLYSQDYLKRERDSWE